MKGTAFADFQTQRGNLTAAERTRGADIHTWSTTFPACSNRLAGQVIDNCLLDAADQVPDSQSPAADIKHQVGHGLAGTVIGHLAAPFRFDDRNISGLEQVLRLASQSLGEYRGMLNQPYFVCRVQISLGGKSAHVLKALFIVQLFKGANNN